LLFSTLLFTAFAAQAQDFEPSQLTLDQVECVGNESTDCDIIQREIYQPQGSKIDEEELQNARIRLQLTGLFHTVDLRLEKSTERGHVKLVVEVQEASPLYTETTIGFPSDHYNGLGYRFRHPDLSFKLGHRNVWGRGKILEATFAPSFDSVYHKKYTGALSYTDPHIGGSRNYFFSDVIGASFRERDFGADHGGDYRSNTLTLGRRLFDFSFVTVGHNYLIQNWRESYEDENWKSFNYFFVSFGWNSEDDPYFVSEGSKFSITRTMGDKYPLGPGSYILNVSKNWSLTPKNVVTLGADSFLYPDNSGHADFRLNPGLQWAYQFRRNLLTKSITDSRLFVDCRGQLQDYQFKSIHNYYYGTAEMGWLFHSNTLGIVKIFGFLTDIWVKP
jgi:outer membrane protein assembly factor BamA